MAGIVRTEYFVLDTGPLLDFFVWQCDKQYYSTWLKNAIQIVALKDEILKDGFRAFLDRHKGRLITSPGVIAELQGHVLRAGGNTMELQRRFWMLVQTQMCQLEFLENTHRIVDMTTDMLIKLGPVDTSIIEIAKANMSSYKRFIVLTSDSGVFKRCTEEEAPVQWITDTIEQFIEESL